MSGHSPEASHHSEKSGSNPVAAIIGAPIEKLAGLPKGVSEEAGGIALGFFGALVKGGGSGSHSAKSSGKH